MKKQMIALATAALLTIGTIIPALAEDGTINLLGGTLSVTAAGVTFTGYTLDGTAHANVAGTTSEWTAKDPTGTGAGWKVMIAASDFKNANGKTISVSGFNVKLISDDIETEAGNNPPTPSSGAAASDGMQLSPTAQKLASAAVDQGMGTYGLTPTFTLDVPAETYAGNYTSAVTVTISSAP